MKTLGKRHSICSNCLRALEADLCLTPHAIYLRKQCTCSPAPTLAKLSSDPEYFLASLGLLDAQPGNAATKSAFSALIIELTDDCNLECPTCVAASRPGAGNYKPLATVQAMIKHAEAITPKPHILMISGGEPTIHPEILRILESACASSIEHIMMITNGKRIAEERSFAEALSKLPRTIEIYLQFDSLRPNVLQDIRGADLSQMRRDAVAVLNELKMPTSLVCVVKRGVNDRSCAEVIKFALSVPCVRGVTFQPIKASGRTDTLKPSIQLIDLAAVRQRIINAQVGFSPEDLIPHPASPENISIGYLAKTEQGVVPVTRALFQDTTGTAATHTNGNCKRHPLFFLPTQDGPRYTYSNLFRVAIVAYMDRYTFCEELLPFEPIGFIMPEGATIPIDTYYMFGRDPAAIPRTARGQP